MDNTIPKRVTVSDRGDVGDVIEWGKNVGISPAIYCAVIYFPSTGECRFYNIDRLTRIE